MNTNHVAGALLGTVSAAAFGLNLAARELANIVTAGNCNGPVQLGGALVRGFMCDLPVQILARNSTICLACSAVFGLLAAGCCFRARARRAVRAENLDPQQARIQELERQVRALQERKS